MAVDLFIERKVSGESNSCFCVVFVLILESCFLPEIVIYLIICRSFYVIPKQCLTSLSQ